MLISRYCANFETINRLWNHSLVISEASILKELQKVTQLFTISWTQFISYSEISTSKLHVYIINLSSRLEQIPCTQFDGNFSIFQTQFNKSVKSSKWKEWHILAYFPSSFFLGHSYKIAHSLRFEKDVYPFPSLVCLPQNL